MGKIYHIITAMTNKNIVIINMNVNLSFIHLKIYIRNLGDYIQNPNTKIQVKDLTIIMISIY